MSAPRLLIDNDILLLLAGANLLERAVAVLGFNLSDTGQLGTLQYMIQRSKRLHFSDERKADITQGCQRVPALQATPNVDLLQQLIDVVDIDDGEAILYALLAETPFYLLTTNDKRAMRAIATATPFQAVRKSVSGRIICLETVLLRLVEQDGVAAVAQALVPVTPDNTLLRVCFSPGNLANPQECTHALHRYLQALTDQVGADFFWKGS